jgi:pSer/pThr/pTyr-binding forkhead associated (FHA) protein
MPLSAKLVVVGGEVKTAEIKLRLPSTIGRGRGATIMLPHPLVSRTHCELYESDGRLMVRDLGSLNGTFVNNQRVTESALPAGELLTVGTVTFRAVYEADEEAVGPPSGPAPEMKSRPQDTDPAATLRANAAGSASKTPAAPHDVEVNFGEPLVDFDDEEEDTGPPPAPPKPAAAAPVQTAGPMAKPAAPAVSKPAAPPAAAVPKPAPAPPAAAPAPPAKDAKTTADSRWNDGPDADTAAAEEDDDFDDFLKSLGEK